VVDPGLSPTDPADISAMILGNYSFSLAALYLIARYLGIRRSLSGAAAEDIDAEILRIPRAVGRVLEYSDQVRQYIGQVSDAAEFYFLGAGPSYGAAKFFQAKFFEQAQRPVFGVQMEEFAHEQFFLLRPERDAQVWFLTPEGPIQGRALEIIAACRKMGANIVSVTATHDQQIIEQADLAFHVDVALELFSPLVTAALGQLLGLFAYERWGNRLPAPSARLRHMEVSRKLVRNESRSVNSGPGR
jgi:glucosamine 6-phosphate synthetase-like amidotransferase/phosphosugar isomerase protein